MPPFSLSFMYARAGILESRDNQEFSRSARVRPVVTRIPTQPSERGSFSKEETRFEVNRGDITQLFMVIEAVLRHFSQGRNVYIVIV